MRFQPHSVGPLTRRTLPLLAALVLVPVTASAQPEDGAHDRIAKSLQRRLQQRPGDGSTWRLFGRLRWRSGDVSGAEQALRKAVELEPLSAAAHADLGRVLAELERPDEARAHLQTAIELAPDSDYAAEARRTLQPLPETADGEDGLTQVGYEIRRFDNSDEPRDLLPDDPGHRPDAADPFSPLNVWIETGVLYDTNVALSPSSRELAPGTRDSFQLFVAPELEWRALDTDTWNAGPTFGGNFTLNEGNFEQFNLQSYRPGAFVSRDVWWGDQLLVPRLHYEFTHDEFDGDTFASRHALTTSVSRLLPDDDAWLYYWSLDHTDFAVDGVLPGVTSRDGWTNALGASRDWRFDRRHLELLRLGLDLQRADTEGTDFRYNGVSLFTRLVLPVAARWDAVLQGSVGYRDYFDYEFDPDRNEIVYRVGGELRRYLTDDCWIAVVVGYDRFDSDNPLFAAERTTGGLVLTYRR